MSTEMADGAAIDIVDLSVHYRVQHRSVRALSGVSFTSMGERRIAIVGESGSGKSTLGLAMLGLLPGTAEASAQRLVIAGQDIVGASERERQRIRGRQVAMIFQDASAALDPVRTVGYQIAEPLRAHLGMDRGRRATEVTMLLGAVRIPDAATRSRQYPHQFSGGMRQRAMIAAGLAGRPAVIVADEPTSALDVTTQAAILELIRELGESQQMTTLLITHDLALVAGFAETVVVLYAGQIVEQGPVTRVYRSAAHPYTRALLSAIPRLDGPRRHQLGTIPGTLPDLTVPVRGCVFETRCWRGHGDQRCRTEAPPLMPASSGTVVACHYADEVAAGAVRENYYSVGVADGEATMPSRANAGPILAVTGMSKTFSKRAVIGRRAVKVAAVSDVDLLIAPGGSVGIVGESGSGKTTLARLLIGLESSDSGEISVLRGDRLRVTRTLPDGFAQMIFQDPGDSLNPLMTIEEIISEPLSLRDHRSWRRYRHRVSQLLTDVGLSPDMGRRFSRQLSGGQRQRVAIARAISTEPQLIIADEAVASLDVSARGQILNLMRRLQRERGFAYLHISHDLSLVRNICDRVVVMYGGRIVEAAEVDEIFAQPWHPYTQLLLDAVPSPDVDASSPKRAGQSLAQVETSGLDLLVGCPFRARCTLASEECVVTMPDLLGPPEHVVACHHADEAANSRSPQGSGTMA